MHADLTQLAVMWFARALANLPTFWGLVSRADRYFRHQRPDAVVLVDYPGFNWWIARRAKVHGIPVFYYTPPQIWAWATWRAKKMRRLADHVLCSLPFEEPWLRERGCNATYVGHPFFDEVRRKTPDERFLAAQRSRGGRLVTILPGSRTQEVAANLPWFLRAAQRVKEAVPDARFAVAAFKDKQAEMARAMIADCGLRRATGRESDQSDASDRSDLSDSAIEVHTGRTPELMQAAECCMACSGSVSLELLHYAKPTVIQYRIGRVAHFVQGFFRKGKYITLVNLLANEGGYPWKVDGRRGTVDGGPRTVDREMFPEYLTWEDRSAEVAGHVIQWLRDPTKRAERVGELERLRERFGQAGASERAARYILEALGRGKDRKLQTGNRELRIAS